MLLSMYVFKSTERRNMKKIAFLSLLVIAFAFGSSLDEIRKNGEIKVGVWTNQPPYSSLENGEFEGFEVDMAKAIGSSIIGNGGKVTLVGIDSGGERIKFLQDDKADIVIASFTETDERKKKVSFSLPYFAVAMGAISSKDRPLNSEKDLNYKTIVIQEGTTMEDYVKKIPGVKVIKTKGSIEAYRTLKDNKADAYIDDNLVVMAYGIVDRGYIVPKGMRNLGFNSFLGIGVKKGNDELLNAVNNEMVKLSKQGFFRKVFNETFVPFYKNEVEAKYFLLEDIYKIFG